MFYAIAAALSVLAGVSQFSASRQAGQAAKDAGKYENQLAQRRADAMQIQAGQKRAEGQIGAMLERRQGRLASSRAISRAAASGAGVSDPTAINILGDIEGISNYRALSSLYQGAAAGQGLEYGAALERAGGEGVRYAGRVQERLLNAQGNIALMKGFAGGAGSLAKGGYFDSAPEGISQTPPVPRPKPTPPYNPPPGPHQSYTLASSGGSSMFSRYGRYGYR